MCYLVTGINSSLTSNASRAHALWDTEEEARQDAEKLLRLSYTEVAVWKQLAVPRVEQKVIWE